ncbi:hypothetical protein [Ensifer sp. BR816]|uniref:hypothetical protein n=1 Tax=Rhizobium sp. (strain BR816) TaxID=1057002 RepID=UPI00036971B9|nr:hypothetical protein [Ensifer sp. BR816]
MNVDRVRLIEQECILFERVLKASNAVFFKHVGRPPNQEEWRAIFDAVLKHFRVRWRRASFRVVKSDQAGDLPVMPV